MARTILVVDDDRSLCDLITDLLSGEGYEVRCAHDGLDALEAIERDPPDLVLSDVWMPRLDGLGLVVRLAERGRRIPVVLMSAHHQAAEPRTAAFVAKPLDLDYLVGVVGRALAVQPSQRLPEPSALEADSARDGGSPVPWPQPLSHSSVMFTA